VSAVPPGMPALGDVLAQRYRLERVLGEGGMGAVYEATQLDLGRPVAIKVMLAQYSHDGAASARFQREARVTAALHHPGVVKIFDFGRDEQNRSFLVMERLVGSMLREHVHPEAAPMPSARAIDIGVQIADVLVATHELGRVHGDLKAGNVFPEKTLDGSDRVVVVDFGLGYIEERPDASRLTKEGVIAGTPTYMSPEQCAGKGIGPASDVYALGCMLYEMACGVPPFDGQSLQLLVQHSFEEPVPPTRKRAGVAVPHTFEVLILEMLGKRPDARPTAAVVVERLRHLASAGDRRERGRNAELLEGRAARMIATVNAPGTPTGPEGGHGYREPPHASAAPTTGKLVAVVGTMGPGFALGLRANGFAVQEVQSPPLPEGTSVILALDQGDVALTNLLSFGPPVVADADADDVERMSRLVAMGVADVVPRPARVEQLVSKLDRAIKKAARRR